MRADNVLLEISDHKATAGACSNMGLQYVPTSLNCWSAQRADQTSETLEP